MKQKEIERYCTEKLFEFANFKKWKIEKQRDQPDALISSAKGEIFGLETTLYHQNPNTKRPMYQQEILWRKSQWYLHDQRALLKKSNPIREISGRIFFHDLPPNQSDIQNFVEEMMEFTKKVGSLVQRDKEIYLSPDDEFKILKKYVFNVRLLRVPGVAVFLWDAPDLSSGSYGLSSDELIAILDRKDKKFETYKKNIGHDRIRLLVSARGDSVWNSFVHQNDIQHVSRKNFKRIIESPFKKIWLADNFSKWAVEVKKIATAWEKNKYRAKVEKIIKH